MKYYVGLDVSVKETSVCIMNMDGDIIAEKSVPSEPQTLADYLSRQGKSYERIGLEAGSLSPWLCHEMREMGLPVICIESRHASAAMAAQNVKTDKNDARGLAHIMRAGWYKVVHIKSPESQKIRVLLNNRKCLQIKMLDITHQIRGTLKVFGLKVGKVSSRDYEYRIRELIRDDEELISYIEPLLIIRDQMIRQFEKLDKLIMNLAKDDPVCQRFMSIPGVGPLTSLSFKTAIDQPERFKKSKNVGVHLGLTPRKYASGEVDYNGRITKCGDNTARANLYTAAQIILTKATNAGSLRSWGLRIAERSSRQKAYVAVARKLSLIMHRMWIDGTYFSKT
ncbi:MAG: IS110 family transposase [Alphaproteobacteria bacterium]|nr:IS110 family transposase [Alphaproteobacteria bacterium]